MTGSGTAILLVEDDANDVILIRRAFAKAEIKNPVYTVEDGDAAVAYLAGEGTYANRGDHPLPGVVLLDLKLPRRSGLEVLQWVRQSPTLRRLPVVVLTSSRESADVNRAYDLGANSYLVKPVGFDALTDLVRILQGYWVGWNEKPEIEPA
ncbi:MAG TPA: response regulator [Gemmatimonadales bacterium]